MGTRRYAAGEWLTRSFTLTAAAGSLALTAVAIVGLAVTGRGNLDLLGRPLGTDFSAFWSAGRLALEGHAAGAYDWTVLHAFEQQMFGPHVPLTAFAYPPPFLLVTAAIALLPYLAALVAWQIATLAPAVWLATRIVPHPLTALVALGCPAVLLNLLHGQNAFLTAFLLGAGLWQLDRRPVLAGFLFGCLIYKPHLGLIVPVVLIAGRHWRAFFAAAFCALGIVLLTGAAFGFAIWQTYIDALPFFRRVLIDMGGPGYEKMQSAFAATRMWGGSLELASGVQTIVSAVVIAACAYLSFGRRSPDARNAAICAAAALATPFVLDYDLIMIEIGVAFLVADRMQRGFADWEKTALALIWVAPALARGLAMTAMIPLGLLASSAVLVLALSRHQDIGQAIKIKP
jgi:hypothetical protein